MRPVHEAEGPLTRDEEAGAWCARLASGSLSPGEQAEFDRWTADSPDNAAAFDQALYVWQSLHVVSDSPEIIGMRTDALNALRRANQRRWSHGGGWQRPLAVAASLILVLIASVWLLPSRLANPDPAAVQQASSQAGEAFQTGVGERRAFLLPDGSRVSLDAETRITVDYQADRRQLALLSGRAKFDVAKDPSRPFTVTAGGRTVLATGTAFSVELLGQQVRVIVYEGHVAVAPGPVDSPQVLLETKDLSASRAISLQPGKELVASAGAMPSARIVEADISRSLAWEGGQLNFVDEPLSSAVERLNRYSPQKLVVADGKAAGLRINGVFNAGDSEAFVEAIAAAYGVRVGRSEAGTVLSTDVPRGR